MDYSLIDKGNENIDNERMSKFEPEIFFIVKAHYVTIVN